MNAIRAGLACSLVSLLAACGGGGGGGDSGSSANYPTSGPTEGDWFSYSQTAQVTLPVASTTTQDSTRYYSQVRSDGTALFVDMAAAPNVSTTVTTLDASGGIVSDHGCTYSPSFRSAPPRGAGAGASYTNVATRTCSAVTSLPRSSTLSTSGKVDGPESRTIALGTFDTFKSTSTLTTTSPIETIKIVSTCWDDMWTGVMIECLRESSTTAAGATSPYRTASTRNVLVAYGRSGQEPVGPAARRFAGTWFVQFSGDDSGSCPNVHVALDGTISGTCAFRGTVAYGVTGSIADNGAVRVNVNNGAQLTGTAGRPHAASGTWTLGNLRGSWTALHR